jgi:hypothetical protein
MLVVPGRGGAEQHPDRSRNLQGNAAMQYVLSLMI